MLDQGIVRWSHVKYTLTATSHIPHDFFRHIFQTMESTQQNVRTRDLDGLEPDKFSKECINSLLGLWAKPKLYSTSVESVTYTEDLQRSGPALKRAVPGHATLHDYIFEKELQTLCSMRPIQQITLDMEHVFLATAHRLARKFCEPRAISSFVTDAVVRHPSTVQRKKLVSAAEATTHPDNTPMFRVKDSSACLICATEPPVTGFSTQPLRSWCGTTSSKPRAPQQ